MGTKAVLTRRASCMKTCCGWFYTFAFDYYYYHCNWLNFVREQDFFLLLLCFIPAGCRVGSNCYFLRLNESTLCEIRLPWVLASSTFQEVIVPQLWGAGVQSGWSWGCFVTLILVPAKAEHLSRHCWHTLHAQWQVEGFIRLEYMKGTRQVCIQ